MPKFIGWVPTPPEYIDPFFELSPVSSSDVVYDLGSGDGRLLFAAIDKGAGRCVGIDIDPERIKSATEESKNKGMDGKVTFIEADVMTVDLSQASVILCYLYPTASAALRPKFEKELKPGTRVVMESFSVPGWKPSKVKELNSKSYFFYTMPAERTADYDRAIDSTSPYSEDYY